MTEHYKEEGWRQERVLRGIIWKVKRRREDYLLNWRIMQERKGGEGEEEVNKYGEETWKGMMKKVNFDRKENWKDGRKDWKLLNLKNRWMKKEKKDDSGCSRITSEEKQDKVIEMAERWGKLKLTIKINWLEKRKRHQHIISVLFPFWSFSTHPLLVWICSLRTENKMRKWEGWRRTRNAKFTTHFRHQFQLTWLI